MAGSVVQSAVNTPGAAATTVSVTLGATATNGNFLVAIGNADATMTTPSGYTLQQSVVSGSGFYVWTKTSDGTETGLTVTNSASALAALMLIEIAGCNALDVFSTPTQTGASTTSVACSTITTTGANGDLVFAVAGTHAWGTLLSAPSFNNSFTFLADAHSNTSAGASAGIFAGYFVQGTAGAVGATTCSWTTASADRSQIQFSFKASAGGGAASPPPSNTDGVRKWLPRLGRAFRTSVLPAARRAPQQPATPRRKYPFRRPDGYTASPPPKGAAPPQPLIPAPPTPRRKYPFRRPDGFTAGPPLKGPAPPQALPPQPATPRRKFPFRRPDGYTAGPPTAIKVVVPPQPTRDRLMPQPFRRGHSTQPPLSITVTVQALPPQQPTAVRHGALLRRKARVSSPPLTGATAATTQAIPPQQPQARRYGFMPRKAAHRSIPVPFQAVVTAPLPPQPASGRRRPPPRRPDAFTTPPTAIKVVVPSQPTRDRLMPQPFRRAKSTTVPPVTVTVTTTQGLPPQPKRSRLHGWLPRRKGTTSTAYPASVVVTVVTGGMTAAANAVTGMTATDSAVIGMTSAPNPTTGMTGA